MKKETEVAKKKKRKERKNDERSEITPFTRSSTETGGDMW